MLRIFYLNIWVNKLKIEELPLSFNKDNFKNGRHKHRSSQRIRSH